MTNEPFDQNSCERRWAQVLRESPEKVANRPPNALLLAEIGAMQPGFALDAGCGTDPRRSGSPPPGGRSLRSTCLRGPVRQDRASSSCLGLFDPLHQISSRRRRCGAEEHVSRNARRGDRADLGGRERAASPAPRIEGPGRVVVVRGLVVTHLQGIVFGLPSFLFMLGMKTLSQGTALVTQGQLQPLVLPHPSHT